MYEPDFWTSSAEAMELSIEGNRLIARETGLPVRRAEDPLTAVARGTGQVIDHIDSYWNVLENGQEVA